MWLLVPICKNLQLTWEFPGDPHFQIISTPHCPVSPRMHSSWSMLLPLKLPLRAQSFHEHRQGSQPSIPNTENGTGNRLWEVGLIYIQDHTVTDAAPKAQLNLKRNPLSRKKNTYQEDWQRERWHSPAEPTGETASTSRFVSAYAKI